MTDDYTKRLQLIVEGKVGRMVGLPDLTRSFDKLILQQDRMTAAAVRDSQIRQRLSDKANLAYAKEVKNAELLRDKYVTAQREMQDVNTRRIETQMKMDALGRERGLAGWRLYKDEIVKLDAEMAASAKKAGAARDAYLSGNAAAGTASRDLSIASAGAYSSSLNAQRSATKGVMLAGAGQAMAGIRAVSTGSIGLGVGILGGGIYTGQKYAQWQKFVSQTLANSPIAQGQSAALQRIAWQYAQKYGASPQDVLTAARYGSDLGLQPQLNARTTLAAMKTALPTGAPIQEFLPAIGAAQVNFAGYRNRPMAVANMLLQTARLGRINNPGDLASQIGQTYIAGAPYGDQMLPQMLALVATLTRAGVPINEANTMAYNMVFRTATPTPAVLKYLKTAPGATGAMLRADFTPQAMQDKGIAGILGDIHGAHLDRATLRKLFPYMRAYLGMLPVTGSLYNQYTDILGGVQNAPQTNPIGPNWNRYQGLATTKEARAQQQFNKAVLDFGKTSLPVLTEFIKNVTPVIKSIDQWEKHNQLLIKSLVSMAPALIGVGLGLKAVSGAVKIAEITGAGKAIKGLGLLFADLMGGTAAAGDAGVLAAAAGGSAEAGSIGSLAALGPVGAAIAGVVAFGLTAHFLYDHWTGFHTWADNIAADFQKIGSAAQTTGANILGTTPGKIGAVLAGPGTAIAAAGMLPILIPGIGIAYIASKLDKHGKPTSSPNYPGNPATPNVKFYPGAHPSASAFGLRATNQAEWNQPLTALKDGIWVGNATSGHWLDFSKHPSTFHWDVQDAGKRLPWKLPGGLNSSYSVVGVRREVAGDFAPGTYDINFKTPNGGYLQAMHSQTSLPMNIVVQGGTPLGYTDPTAGHLHIGGDTKAQQYVYGVTGGKGWSGIQQSFGAGQSTGGTDWSKVPKAVAQYKNIIAAASKKYGVAAPLIAAVIWTESKGIASGPGAIGPPVIGADGSVHHAYGLMQIMDYNFAGLGITNWADPTQNIMGGTRLLAGNINTSKGNIHTALNAYSGGGADIRSAGTGGKTYAQYTTGNASKWTNQGYSGGNPATFGASDVSAVITARFGSNPNASKMSPADRADYRTLLEQEINLSHAADVTQAQLIGAPQHLLTQLHNRFTWAKAHPFAWASSGGSKKTLGAYGAAIFSERHAKSALSQSWHGINVSQLPATGNGGLNQQSYLKYEYQTNMLTWQIADNTAKSYAIAKHMSKAWLAEKLKEDRKAHNRANQNARFRNSSAGGEADFVRMPELVGRCKAEAEANILRRKRIKQGEHAAKANDTKIRLLRQIERHLGGADHPGRHVHARAVAGTGGHAIGHDPRLHGFTNDTLVGS